MSPELASRARDRADEVPHHSARARAGLGVVAGSGGG